MIQQRSTCLVFFVCVCVWGGVCVCVCVCVCMGVGSGNGVEEATVSNSGIESDIHSLTLSTQQTFPSPITASPTLPGAKKQDFGETAVARDMPEPCEFPPLHMRAHKEVNHAPHPVTGLVLQAES